MLASKNFLYHLLLSQLFVYTSSASSEATTINTRSSEDDENSEETDRLTFEDPYFGTLVPSTQNVTFLTVDDPEYRDTVLVYPTDKQKRLMKEWRDRGVNRRNGLFRFRRQLQCQLNLKGFVRDEFGEIRHARAPGEEVPDLAFDKLEENSYFRAFLIFQRRLDSYVDNRFGLAMQRVKNGGKPWLPADELKEELKDCHYLVKTFASSHDFKFDRETGGNITYYKFSCEQVQQYILFAFATYDSKFTLMPHTVTESDDGEEQKTGSGLHLAKATKKRQRTEKRHLTWKEKEDLMDYIGKMVRRQIKFDYGTYFAEEDRLASCTTYKL